MTIHAHPGTNFKLGKIKWVRFILGKSSRAQIGQTELDSLGLLNVKDRVTQLKLNHVYKITRNITPNYLSDNVIRVSDVHNYSTRHSEYNFIIPASPSNTFFVTAIKNWNALSSNIKNAS